MADPIHLAPTAELAERVLLPGDPGRALLLAQDLLQAPRMFNHHRGLWGYTGTASDGLALTVQSTGMGGPSAAIVVSELIALGAKRLLRVGTCGALDPDLALGDLLVAVEAIGADGTSRALGAGPRAQASPEVVEGLDRAAPVRSATVVSTDLFYEDRVGTEEAWIAAGAAAVEMESATLFTLAAKHGVAAGALLIVSDLLVPARARIGPEELKTAELRAGAVAISALSAATDGAGHPRP